MQAAENNKRCIQVLELGCSWLVVFSMLLFVLAFGCFIFVL